MTSDPNNIELRRRQLQPQQSSLYMRKQQAICVRRAYKSYGNKKDPCIVLDGLDMTVPKGVIYGLLGASGCGKTTLLSCIVGRKQLQTGEIWVLGGAPRSKASGIPGPRLGYMPQELALYGEFTIIETLRFFGWVTGMDTKYIEVRTDFLMKLLMLPAGDLKINQLSVGQQRRVSLASALLHEPELLILDEPTVGVDPLLRQIIWDHFVEITTGGSTTIIITTHYIDETRQANLIGLMRAGYLLAEESPASLLNRMAVDTLEEVFLKLSIVQNMGRRRESSIAQEIREATPVQSGIDNVAVELNDVESCEISGEFGDNISLGSRRNSIASRKAVSGTIDLPEVPPQEGGSPKFSDYLMVLRKNNMKALLWKNSLWMIRNISVMLLVLALPVMQISIFCICIGHDPRNLTIAVVNNERGNITDCGSISCNNTQLGCNYLGYLEDEETLILKYYTSENDATNSVLHGKTYASIVIPNNYSAALQMRIALQEEAKIWDINYSTIDVLRDSSSPTVTQFLQLQILKNFIQFMQDYLDACEIDNRLFSTPFRLGTPVYGENIPKFTDFITPGIVLAVTFALGVGLTATSMTIERSEGSLDRYLVMGITEIELLLAHVVCEFIILTIQLILTMICTFAVFQMTLKGSIVLVTVLVLLSGFCGMCFGFTISSAFKEERTAQMAAMGSLAPMLILCGVIWPVEGMHPILKPIINYFPLTKTTESLRSLLERGWDLYMPPVYWGFISVGIWISIFLAMSILLLKFKKE